MSTPIMPMGIFVYKIIKEYQKTEKKQYSKQELIEFAEKAMVIAGQIDNQEYCVLIQNEPGFELKKKLSKICDCYKGDFVINNEKLQNGGNDWAEKIIGAMKHSFLRGSVITLDEELKEKKEAKVRFSK